MSIKAKLIEHSLKQLVTLFIRHGPSVASKYSRGFWKRFNAWLNGKTIAIIGATASGKNSMFNQLRNEPPPKEHIQTRGVDKIKSFKIKRSIGNQREVEFWSRHSVNIGGETDEKERYWEQACENADLVFYLVDLERLKKHEEATTKRIRDDFRWLGSRASRWKSGRRVHIFLNKIDTVDDTLMDVDDLQAHLQALLKNDTERISKIARAALGDNSDILTGTTPITTMHRDLFNTLFDSALVNIFKNESAT